MPACTFDTSMASMANSSVTTLTMPMPGMQANTSMGSNAFLKATGARGDMKKRWCNRMYESACPFNAQGQCKYLHIDAFVGLSREARMRELEFAPDLMEQNVRTLTREMNKIVRAAAMRTSYEEVADSLRAMGWQIPALQAEGLEDVIFTILGLLVRSMHFDCRGCADIIFDTVGHIMSFASTTCPVAPPMPPTPPSMPLPPQRRRPEPVITPSSYVHSSRTPSNASVSMLSDLSDLPDELGGSYSPSERMGSRLSAVSESVASPQSILSSSVISKQQWVAFSPVGRSGERVFRYDPY
eukprot:TRINITY_DN1363_c0_g4_i2.p1 TRINITY_DN1363_c0_g4~~TRINITY_DN1363_c0_g4_i2.p1  ORF type:complete len:298 (+),score=98.40 TRINITY_DN1363_c0_g4_i2:87-980(+)